MSETILICNDQGVPYAELEGGKIGDVNWPLLGIGQATFTIDPKDEKAVEVLLNKREVQFWYDDELAWWGIPRRTSGNSKQLTFECQDLKSHFDFRFVMTASLQYTSIDLFQIGWNLVSVAQTGLNMNRRIVAGNWLPAGIPASAWYHREEHQNILELLDSYAEMDNNFRFEWEIVIYPDGRREWMPYLKRGSFKPDLGLEWGSPNVVDFTYNEDGMEQATYLMKTGGTDTTGQKVEQPYEDVAASEEYGVMQAVSSDGNQLEPDYLLSKATAEVEARNAPVVIPDLIVRDTEDVKLFGVLVPGDVIPVEVDCGRVQMHGNYRITNIKRDAKANLTLSFNKDVA